MQTRDMTEPLGGVETPIDWQHACDELLTSFNEIAKDAPPGYTATKLVALGEKLTWTLERAPVADDAKYRAPTTVGKYGAT